jgi:hypothetical protein
MCKWICFPIVFLVLTLCPATAQSPVVTKFLDLFASLRAAQAIPAGPIRPHITGQLSEAEVNQYMREALRITPRPGLNSLNVKFFPQNYISTFTVLDFDAVERWKPGTVPAVLRPILKGQKSVWVDFRFQVQNGQATFSVEKAYYQSLRLPAFFVQKMMQIVAARQPEHYDTTKPVPLPFGLRKMWTGAQVAGYEN